MLFEPGPVQRDIVQSASAQRLHFVGLGGPGNAILLNGVAHVANREIGVPGRTSIGFLRDDVYIYRGCVAQEAVDSGHVQILPPPFDR